MNGLAARGFASISWPRRLGLLCLVLLELCCFAVPQAGAEYADVVLNNSAEASGVRPVIYPHWFHRMRFRCKVCHGELGFVMRAGANKIDMASIMDGKFCGMCHNGDVAWNAEHCDRCHSGLPGLATGIRGGDSAGGPGVW